MEPGWTDGCTVSREGPRDDPSAPEYDGWRSLIGQVVATFSPDLDAAPSAPWIPTVFEVTDAIIAHDEAYLLIREWPSNEELWVGGVRHGMYSMGRRPDGGFQVAGDKFILIGSRRLPIDDVIEQMGSQLDADGLRELRTLLERSRGAVSME